MNKQIKERYKERAKELLEQMTLEEKVGQMVNDSPAIKRLGIKRYNWWNEALHGVARAGVATVFPQAIGLSATFDKELLQKVGDCISTEGRAKYNMFQEMGDYGSYKGLTFWSPNINIFRDPRWGRGHETFGEDPYLTAEIGIRFIKGIQGDDEKHLKAGACVKHFVAHSGPEATRHGFDDKVSKKDFYETYFPAFERCVKEADVLGVMGAYNAVNGEPCCASETLIKALLRARCGFDGYFVSDCDAVSDLYHSFHKRSTLAESAALAAKSGCDLNCGNAYSCLINAVEENLLSEKDIDECVLHLLEAKLRLGLIDGEHCVYNDVGYLQNDSESNHELCLKAAEEGLVLLKNDGILPLNIEKIKSVAVIGPNADDVSVLLGNYNGTPSVFYTVLGGIRKVCADKASVRYAEGCHLYKKETEGGYGDRFAEAEYLASHSDVVILCLGLSPLIEGEQGDAFNSMDGGDKQDLKLPGLQEELFEKICAANKNVIVANISGSAVELAFAENKARAVLQCWYPGMFGGLAVANVLFGKANPSGKLPVTFYKNSEQLPPFEDYSMQNRTYKYFDGDVLYKFGYGLSYTAFELTDLKTSGDSISKDGEITLSVEIRNAGARKGAEVVQVYVKPPMDCFNQPKYQLRAFEKVCLDANESKRISFELNAADFDLINEEGESFLPKGEFAIFVGNSQPDERSLKKPIKVY